jgi:hypothetical protein
LTRPPVARYLAERRSLAIGGDEHLRVVLECFELKRLTTQVNAALLEILERRYTYVDDVLRSMGEQVVE